MHLRAAGLKKGTAFQSLNVNPIQKIILKGAVHMVWPHNTILGQNVAEFCLENCIEALAPTIKCHIPVVPSRPTGDSGFPVTTMQVAKG